MEYGQHKIIKINASAYIKKVFLFILLAVGLVTLSACKEDEVTLDTVTITFDTGANASVVDPITGIAGKNIPDQSNPTREGFDFVRWDDAEGNSYRLTRFPKESITLYARWAVESDDTSIYKIEFLTNSNQYVMPVLLHSGEDIPELPLLTYFMIGDRISSFDTWYYNGEEFDMDTMPSEDIVLHANWILGDQAIFFDTDTDLELNPVVADPGEEIVGPEVIIEDEGRTFTGWSYNGRPYIFDTMPSESITLSAEWQEIDDSVYNEVTNLPKMYINLENSMELKTVTKTSYVDSSITIFSENDSDVLTAVSALFRGRGNGSWWESGPKRGYRIKFVDKQEMFGEEKSKHWVLLASANFYDPTLMKTKMAFGLADEVFDYIDYASSTNWVELYVNGEYRGVYILAEQTKVDDDRIDIESDFGVLDTGYLIEYDSYAGEGVIGLDYFRIGGFRYGFTVKSPDPDDYAEEGVSESVFKEQIKFIKNYTDVTLHAALDAPSSASAYDLFTENADVDSFVDMYILHELFKNTDTGWSSFYMYKEAGGKLYATNPWDFDASAGKNRGNQSPTGLYVAGSVANESSHTSSELYLALMQVEEFQNEVKDRWNELSSEILMYINMNINDTFINENKEALAKNFYFWSVNRSIEGQQGYGDNSYTRYSSLASAQTGWAIQMNGLKDWLIDRVEWLDNEWS